MSEREALTERAKAVKARHSKRLLAIPGVIGVGVGFRQRNGHFTDEVAIVVMVEHKVESEDVPYTELIPSQLEGVPVDVQETGEIKAN